MSRPTRLLARAIGRVRSRGRGPGRGGGRGDISLAPGGPYLAAVEADLRGEEDSALDLFSKAVREDPGNLDAAIRLGRLLRVRGEHDRAYRLHRNQLTRRALTREEREAIRLDLARDLAAAGRRDEAFEVIDGILAQNRRDLAARSLRIELFEDLGRWDEAFDELKAQQRAAGRGDRPALARYQAMLARRCLDRAERAKSNAPELHGRSSDLDVKAAARAADDRADKHRTDAKAHLKRALKLDGGCAQALLWAGELASAAGDTGRAEKHWRKALELGGRREGFTVFKRLERLLFEVGRYGEMAALYRDHIGRHPDDARARIALSSYYRRRGEFKEALAVLGASNDFDRQSRRLLDVARIRSLAEAGRGAEAASEALELLGVGPEGSLECAECGFSIDDPRWRCPECGRWSTFF
ncbi:MAG: hypothetical protein CME06_08910 [Gemmatimonadetes bacterium]|nr:hypothetical protein [Gemmatimonadota bacterium]